MTSDYDLIIVGSGPAGLTAALYSGRAKLSTAILEKGTLGGSIVNAESVENFPGFPKGISGSKLGANLLSQVMKYGAEFKQTEVIGIDLRDDLRWASTTEGEYSAKAVIIAGGAQPKRIGCPGEEEFAGKGVFYCVMCDGSRFANQKVAIIGGGDGGVSGALYMARIASKATVTEILPKLTATAVLQERAQANPEIEILCSTKIEKITADGDLKTLCLKNMNTGERSNLEVSGIFVLIGLSPQTEYLQGLVEMDNLGYVMVNDRLETSVPGIFAAGDIRKGTVWQAITAAGDGAAAALAAERFISLN